MKQTATSSEMDAVKRSGTKLLRINIERPIWLSEQATYEKVFRLAAERDITILPVLIQANGFPVPTEEPEYNEWYVWVKQVVKRYGYGGSFWSGQAYVKPVTAWEVWNEPNLPDYNRNGIVNPKGFGKFLDDTANAIRTAQDEQAPGTSTQVLMGGLFLAGWKQAGIENYLKEVYSAGDVYNAYDGLAIHPYAFKTKVNTFGQSPANEYQQELIDARLALNNMQWGPSRSLWITEMGWPIENFGNAKVPVVSEPDQATLLQQSFDWTEGIAAGYKLQSIIWYNHRDRTIPSWDYHIGLRKENGAVRPAWGAFLAQNGAVQPAPKGIDELGFVRYNTAPSNTQLRAYVRPPYYDGLITARSSTAYPAISDPQNIQGIAIDWHGDGIDELGFLRYNSSKTHLDTYIGSPNYQTLASSCDTAYPAIADPQNVQGMAIDWNGGGVDELGFVRLNTGSGYAHLDTYTGTPCYTTLASVSDTAYPAIADPQNVQALAIDTNGDGVDELGFVRLKNNNPAGSARISTYGGPPSYKDGILTCATGYPEVSDTQNVQALAIDTNGDGVEELGFLRYNAASGKAHLDTYTNAPCYDVLASASETGHPAVSEPQNVQGLAINTTTDPAPGGWYSDNIGGTVTSDPDVASWGVNHLHVFARGTGNTLVNSFWNGNGWSGWGNMGGPVLASGPGAVSWGQFRIDVVARVAADNSIQHWWWNGTSWLSDNLGASFNSDPEISSWGPNRLDVFARGAGNALYHKYWGGSWSGWEKIGGSLASGPSAVSWGPGRIDVVARTTSNTVQHWWWDDASGGGWKSDNLGGSITSDPDISSWGPNRLDVYARGANNDLQHKYWDNGWSAWGYLDGTLTSGPGAVSWSPGRLDVFARTAKTPTAAENSVQHWFWLDP